MANQAIWIGIAISVFFAGLGIGYAAFQSSPSSMMLQSRQQMMAQMMSDPATMNDWMNQMMANPQAMQKMHDTMMSNPDHMQQMHAMMMNNPQHMQQMMGQMMMDPATMQQMHQMMFQDPQHMQQMMGMMNMTGMNPGMMGQGMMNPNSMMGPGMMGQGMMMGSMMMGTPITKQSDVLKTIDKIEDLLDQVSTKYSDGDSVGALSTATEAYLENYEYIEGAIASKDPDQMEKVELMLRQDLRHAINTGQSAEEINSTIDSIKKELDNIRNLF
ncbi:hypothetical protein [Candidatus Nitrosotenuis cloacae]|uniref:DUF4175 domain-containing protein n=1 Tax=Candidatus Nitrosotenuis cloacae TaxID=1603555 RepID=A0A3G1B121_9ARCH|nr:hypothetical protein [Candidatus Nitrosotenuis cloacae]AJZ75823.1 hypothetical protein SU86_004970 [Candidatus Nitrosotenuis cloacae]